MSKEVDLLDLITEEENRKTISSHLALAKASKSHYKAQGVSKPNLLLDNLL